MIFFCEKFINIRKQSGIKVFAITRKIGIRRSTLWNWENGKTTPSEENIRKLAKMMNISVRDISDLPETHKVPDDELFKVVSDMYDFSGNISLELIKQQKNAINTIQKINSELNKVWRIVLASLKAVEDIVYIKNIDNKYIAVNDSFKKHLSLAEDYNVSNKTDNDFFSIAEAKTNSFEDNEIMNSGETASPKEDYIPGSRKKKWGIISKYPISDNTGKITGLIVIIRDITETKELKWMQNILIDALNHSNDLFTIRNIKSKNIVFASNTIKNKFGYKNEQFTDKKNGFNSWLNILHPDDRAQEAKYFNSNDFPAIRLCRLFHNNGKMYWIEISSFKTSYDNEEYLCSISRDVTEEKKADQINKTLQASLIETRLSIAKKMIEKKYSKTEIFEITGITNIEYNNISEQHNHNQ